MSVSSSLDRLRARIGWVCWVLRVCATGYATWGIVSALRFWLDSERVAKSFAGWYGGLPALVDAPRRWAGFGTTLAIWVLVVFAVIAVWRLTRLYFAGEIFSVDAAAALKRVGLFGALAAFTDVLARPVICLLLSPGPGLESAFFSRWIHPNDLLFMAVFGAFWLFGHVLEAAASLSDDVESFV